MPKIAEEDILKYDSVIQKMERLGLISLFEEIQKILTGFELRLEEKKDANGGAELRKIMDKRFEKQRGWTKKVSGGIDWTKCLIVNGTRVCIGVELQFSARSDLVIVDIIHLRKGLTDGAIDVGVLVVPNNTLGPFLTDRGPRLADAKRHVREARVDDLPLVVIGIQHDGPGPPLPKQYKRTTARKRSK